MIKLPENSVYMRNNVSISLTKPLNYFNVQTLMQIALTCGFVDKLLFGYARSPYRPAGSCDLQDFSSNRGSSLM